LKSLAFWLILTFFAYRMRCLSPLTMGLSLVALFAFFPVPHAFVVRSWVRMLRPRSLAVTELASSNVTDDAPMPLPLLDEDLGTATGWWQQGDLGSVIQKMARTRNAKIRLAAMMYYPQHHAAEEGILRLEPRKCDQDDAPGALRLGDQRMIDLGTLGYLGLTNSERYRRAIVEALDKYGATFCISPQWMRDPFALETTHLVETVFGRPAILAKSCSIATFHFFSSVIKYDPHVAVIIDADAHESLRDQATSLAQVEHSSVMRGMFDYQELEELVTKMKNLSGAKTIWYVADGQVSLTGEQIPVRPLLELQKRHPELWVFCDDAHGAGWSGKGGIGHAPELVLQEADTNAEGFAEEANRWVIATSFSKGFAADGGALILPDQQTKEFVELFSPFSRAMCARLPTADLAMIHEAMKMSLDGTIDHLQAELHERINYLHTAYRRHLKHLMDIPLEISCRPVLHIPLDMELDEVIRLVKELHNRGIFVAPTGPPAAAGLGLRLTVQPTTTHNDIDTFFTTIAELLERSVGKNT